MSRPRDLPSPGPAPPGTSPPRAPPLPGPPLPGPRPSRDLPSPGPRPSRDHPSTSPALGHPLPRPHPLHRLRPWTRPTSVGSIHSQTPPLSDHAPRVHAQQDPITEGGAAESMGQWPPVLGTLPVLDPESPASPPTDSRGRGTGSAVPVTGLQSLTLPLSSGTGTVCSPTPPLLQNGHPTPVTVIPHPTPSLTAVCGPLNCSNSSQRQLQALHPQSDLLHLGSRYRVQQRRSQLSVIHYSPTTARKLKEKWLGSLGRVSSDTGRKLGQCVSEDQGRDRTLRLVLYNTIINTQFRVKVTERGDAQINRTHRQKDTVTGNGNLREKHTQHQRESDSHTERVEETDGNCERVSQ
ncbi:basic proline-rich protein-like [Pristis pectinata]|uniref:basic proline-rich protein-like n=1 Tax=Pristis pectinata TaxID=685728 RepID=UPI00223CBBCB|nr:basic proline-rich protein-like [Pristis pectinata]